MTHYQQALQLAETQNYGELFEFLAGKIGTETLMHIYELAQAELTQQVNASCPQYDVVYIIQSHILN